MNAEDAASKARKFLIDAWQAYVDGLITWHQWRHLVALYTKKR
jgi:hypothetical protein